MITRFRHYLPLFVILLVALAIRLWHIQWGLPELYEEAFPFAVSWKFWNWGQPGIDLNPHFFNYPGLTFYLNFLVQVAHFVVGYLSGSFASLSGYQHAYAVDPTMFVVLSRLLSVGFDAGTVVVLFKLGNEIGDETVGLIAAGSGALCPLLIRQSQLINVDSPLTFYSTLSLLLLYRIYSQPATRWYILSGVSIGLAASSKYNGALLVVVLAASHFFRTNPVPKKESYSPLLQLALAGIISAVTFAICNPYILLDFGEFYRDFSFEEMHMGAGHLGADPTLTTWQYYLLHALPGAIGWALIAASVAALCVALYRRKIGILLLSLFPILYLGMICSWKMRADRYLLPVVPPLLLLAALGVVALADTFAKKLTGNDERATSRSPRIRPVLAALLTVLILIQPISSVTAYHRSFGLPDTRVLAKQWLLAHTLRGAVIASIPFGIEFPDSSRRIFPIPFLAVNTERIASFYDTRWYADCDVVVGTSYDYERYRNDPARYAPFIAFYDSLRTRWQLAAEFEPNDNQPGPTIWLYRPPASSGTQIFSDGLMRRLEAAPESSRVSAFLQNLTLTALAKGKLAKAEQLLREILSVEIRNEAARKALVGILLDHGRLEDALDVTRHYLELDPGTATFRWLEGNILMRQQRFREAESALERSLTLDPRISAAYDDLLFIYVQVKDKNKALAVLGRHYAILPPTSEKAQKILADINTLRKLP